MVLFLYKAQISVERLQDHWSSSLTYVEPCRLEKQSFCLACLGHMTKMVKNLSISFFRTLGLKFVQMETLGEP